MRICPGMYIQISGTPERSIAARILWCHGAMLGVEIDRRGFECHVEDQLHLTYSDDGKLFTKQVLVRGLVESAADNASPNLEFPVAPLADDAEPVVVVLVFIPEHIERPRDVDLRQSKRMNTADLNKLITFGDRYDCELQDVSPSGFSVVTADDFALDSIVRAEISDGGETAEGRVRIRNSLVLKNGRFRYGVVCLERQIKSLCGVLAMRLHRHQSHTPAGF